MDEPTFDTLARVVGGLSRRDLTRTLGALTVGGFVVWQHPRADARNKKKGNNKKKNNKKKNKECPGGCGDFTRCCDGACLNVVSDRNNCGDCGTVCGTGFYCANAVCTPCDNPLALCTVAGQEQCVDVRTDRNNCGSCGNICPKDPSLSSRDLVCQNGQCICTGTVCPNGLCCPTGYIVCVADGAACCPTDHLPCNGRCCPPGYRCGGTCGSTCCR